MYKLALALSLFLATAFGTTQSAHADDKLVVLELYTSQGCSSCPPADALLQKVNKDYPDVIALALHVDYWDYIGWKDKFANPAYSKRQKAYASAAGHRSVFTPQMVIGGLDHVIGYKPMDVANTIQKHRNVADEVQVSASLSGNSVVVTLVPKRTSGDYVVQVVGYSDQETVAIKRGENAGRTITYVNTVRDLVDLGKWDGEKVKSMRAKKPKGDQAVVLVQKAKMGPIVGAARVK